MLNRTQEQRLTGLEKIVSQLIYENKDLRAQLAVLKVHLRVVRRGVEKANDAVSEILKAKDVCGGQGGV